MEAYNVSCYENLLLWVCVCVCVCGCVCVYVWNISLAQNSHLFIYLFMLSLFRVAPFSENTAFQGQAKVALIYKMLQLKKQIYANNNNLSQRAVFIQYNT